MPIDQLSQRFISLQQRISLNGSSALSIPLNSTLNGGQSLSFPFGASSAFQIVSAFGRVSDTLITGFLTCLNLTLYVFPSAAGGAPVIIEGNPSDTAGFVIGARGVAASLMNTPVIFWNDYAAIVGGPIGGPGNTITVKLDGDIKNTDGAAAHSATFSLSFIAEIYTETTNPQGFTPVGQEALSFKK